MKMIRTPNGRLRPLWKVKHLMKRIDGVWVWNRKNKEGSNE